jgi:hypothetical protein
VIAEQWVKSFKWDFQLRKTFQKKTEKLFIATKTGWGGRGIPFYCPVRKTDDCLSLHSLSVSLFSSISHFASLFLLFKSFFGVGGVSPAQLPLSLFLSVWSARGQLFIVSTSRQPGANYIEQIVIDSLRLLNFFPSFSLFVYLIFLKFVALCELEFVFYR